MKFLLVFTICSQIGMDCMPPVVHNTHFNSHYECATKGYNVAEEMMADFGQDFVNRHEIVIGFKCKAGSEI